MISDDRAAERVEIVNNVQTIFFTVLDLEGPSTFYSIDGLAWMLTRMDERFTGLDDIRKL